MRPVLLATLALGACTFGPADQNQAANETIATNKVATEAPAALPSQAPVPIEPAAQATGNATNPVTETPAIDETAQDAADVVQRYYALIGVKKYAQAWALWENVGKASGMSAQAFAASFDKYSAYNAQIGAPGAIDAGAGQRYVTVPVQVYGRLKAGNRPFNMSGTVTLHRAVVDGATQEQKSWRIRDADIKPRPAEPVPSPAPTVDNRSNVRFKCVDGSRMTARFDPDNGRVTIVRGGKTLVLKQERMASGIRYASGPIAFAGKGDNMTFSQPGLPPLPCSPIRR